VVSIPLRPKAAARASAAGHPFPVTETPVAQEHRTDKEWRAERAYEAERRRRAALGATAWPAWGEGWCDGERRRLIVDTVYDAYIHPKNIDWSALGPAADGAAGSTWADAVAAAVAERDATLGAGPKPPDDPDGGGWAAIAAEVMAPRRGRPERG
jgi:hypothetical protein